MFPLGRIIILIDQPCLEQEIGSARRRCPATLPRGIGQPKAARLLDPLVVVAEKLRKDGFYLVAYQRIIACQHVPVYASAAWNNLLRNARNDRNLGP